MGDGRFLLCNALFCVLMCYVFIFCGGARGGCEKLGKEQEGGGQEGGVYK